MIKTKEIYNTENKEEFINKAYLTERAVYALNRDIVEVVRSKRCDHPLADMQFNMLNGRIHMLSYLEIFSEDLTGCIMDSVIKAMYDENSSIPQICL